MQPQEHLYTSIQVMEGRVLQKAGGVGLLELDGHVLTVTVGGATVASASAGDGGHVVFSNDRVILRHKGVDPFRVRLTSIPRGMNFQGLQVFYFWRNRELRRWDAELRRRGFVVKNSNRTAGRIIIWPVAGFLLLVLIALGIQIASWL